VDLLSEIVNPMIFIDISPAKGASRQDEAKENPDDGLAHLNNPVSGDFLDPVRKLLWHLYLY